MDKPNKKLENMCETAGKKFAEKIVDVFEGEINKAIEWYNTPCIALGNSSPNEYCEANKYFQVEQELERIEHGIFS
ncbi:MAG: MbcA/ParS/Xre antitoxin family protein [Nanoarchaeota archaeon]